MQRPRRENIGSAANSFHASRTFTASLRDKPPARPLLPSVLRLAFFRMRSRVSVASSPTPHLAVDRSRGGPPCHEFRRTRVIICNDRPLPPAAPCRARPRKYSDSYRRRWTRAKGVSVYPRNIVLAHVSVATINRWLYIRPARSPQVAQRTSRARVPGRWLPIVARVSRDLAAPWILVKNSLGSSPRDILFWGSDYDQNYGGRYDTDF